jgi:hypothetical protein
MGTANIVGLDRWLPAEAFWSATDSVAASATSGAIRIVERHQAWPA